VLCFQFAQKKTQLKLSCAIGIHIAAKVEAQHVCGVTSVVAEFMVDVVGLRINIPVTLSV
jgi:hypothetical protein